MRNIASRMLIFLIPLCGLYGCSLTTIQSPFADVCQLGAVLKPGESITIQSNVGTKATVEYVAPVKRRITWSGESRWFNVLKSIEINGLYSEHAKLHPAPIGQIKDVAYEESTAVLKSQKDVDDLIQTYMEYGYQHIPAEKMFVHLEIRKYFNFGIKAWNPEYLVVLILKYEIDEKNGHVFLAEE